MTGRPASGCRTTSTRATTLTAAAGVYRQTLPAWLLVQHPDNRLLDNQRADHYVAGVRRRLTPSTLLSVEAYRKDYRELPFDPGALNCGPWCGG